MVLEAIVEQEREEEAIELTIKKLGRDVKKAAASLTPTEARYLVDAYYTMQENRKRAGNQILALGKASEPHEIITWLGTQDSALETTIRGVLGVFSQASPVGRWAESITGIGPVISAGLLAHIDITKAPTAGHIWRFAGLDPTVTWDKGQKRPWNAKLKVLAWKIGESFVKVSNNKNDVYGKVYQERKALEIERNEQGLFTEQAAAKLGKFKIGKDTEAFKAYSVGKLPPAHIQQRSQRYATKLFLAHWHHVAYEVQYGTPPPKPYIIEHGGHTHYIKPPNW